MSSSASNGGPTNLSGSRNIANGGGGGAYIPGANVVQGQGPLKNFVFTEKLGSGTYATVYKAFRTEPYRYDSGWRTAESCVCDGRGLRMSDGIAGGVCVCVTGGNRVCVTGWAYV